MEQYDSQVVAALFQKHGVCRLLFGMLQNRGIVGQYDAVCGILEAVGHLMADPYLGKVLEWLVREYPYMDAGYQSRLLRTLSRLVQQDTRFLEIVEKHSLVEQAVG